MSTFPALTAEAGRFQDIVHLQHAAHVHHFTQLTSCVGTNSCGTDSGTLYYGATIISSDDGLIL